MPGALHSRAAATAARLGLLLLAVAALSALDVCFLEETVKPIAAERGIPWSRFTSEVLGVRTMTWHFYFAPAGLLLLGFAGAAVRRDARGALAGPLLMVFGHEDLLYYVLLREAPPPALPWLDLNPAIAWTRALEGAPHVTRAGLLVACALSLAAAAVLLGGPDPLLPRAIGRRWRRLLAGAGGGAAPPVHVRPATEGDLDAIGRMLAALRPPQSAERHREWARAILEGRAHTTLPLALLVAAMPSGRVVGVAEVGLRSHAHGCDGALPVGFLEGWYVEPAHRSRGAGRALVAAAEAWALERGAVEMASDARASNEASRRAHEALGFEVKGPYWSFRRSLRS